MNRWSKEELEFLAEHSHLFSLDELSSKLNRSRSSVSHKTSRLNLKTRDERSRLLSIRNYKHGHGNYSNRLYRIWKAMRERCYYEKSYGYPYYGGRGITVDESWLEYDNFHQWAISNGYNDDLTIDRIDNSKNYCPSNCRFITLKEQANNRRSNRLMTAKGKTQKLQEWLKEPSVVIKERTIRSRLSRGWTDEQALFGE